MSPHPNFYSFVVDAPSEVSLFEHFIVLDRGMNAFTLYTANLGSLLQRFAEEGVKVQQVNKLDGVEAHDGNPALAEATTTPDPAAGN